MPDDMGLVLNHEVSEQKPRPPRRDTATNQRPATLIHRQVLRSQEAPGPGSEKAASVALGGDSRAPEALRLRFRC